MKIERADMLYDYGCNITDLNVQVKFTPLGICCDYSLINVFFFENDLFISIYIVSPFLYQVDHYSVTAIEGYTAKMSCYLLVGFERNQNISWIWLMEDVELNLDTNKFKIESSNNVSSLTINNVSYLDKSNYYCVSKNAYGHHKRSIYLRVKGKYELCFF
jgi:hypothetical protein